MCGCKNKKPVQIQAPVQKIVKSENCEQNFTTISNINIKLNCLENKIPIRVYNSYLGIILSMLNTGRYCDYDVTNILNDLETNGCGSNN